MKDRYLKAIQEVFARREALPADEVGSALLFQAGQADLAASQLEDELRENAAKLVRDAERVDRGERPAMHARVDRAELHAVELNERVSALRLMVKITLGAETAREFLGLLEG